MKHPRFTVLSMFLVVTYVGLVLALAMQFSRNADLQRRVDEFAAHPKIEITDPGTFSQFSEGAVKTLGISGQFFSIKPVKELTVVVSVWNERFKELVSETTVLKTLEGKDFFSANVSLDEPLPLGVYQVQAVAFKDGKEVASVSRPLAIRTGKELRDGGIF